MDKIKAKVENVLHKDKSDTPTHSTTGSHPTGTHTTGTTTGAHSTGTHTTGTHTTGTHTTGTTTGTHGHGDPSGPYSSHMANKAGKYSFFLHHFEPHLTPCRSPR
jgi:hypothetical protein